MSTELTRSESKLSEGAPSVNTHQVAAPAEVKIPRILWWLGTWGIAFFILALLQWPYRHFPYYWDALGYVYSHSHDIYRNSFNPILTTYDVGHPTLFFFLHALATAVVGAGPFGGHLITWAFAALLCVAVYGLACRLDLPRDISILAAIVVMCYPQVWASVSQICLDLPMAAAFLAAFWAFSGRRWGWYIFFGAIAALIKAYGFLVIAGTFGSVLLTSGLFWQQERRGDFIKRTVIAWSPLLTFLGYAGVRYLARGPGAFVNHQTGSNIHTPLEWDIWKNNLGIVWSELFQTTLLDHLLIILLLLFMLNGVKYLYNRCTDGANSIHLSESNSLTHKKSEICCALSILLSYPIVSTLAFTNLSGLVARYMIPATACLLLIGMWLTWQLVPGRISARRTLMYAAFVPSTIIFMILWHPDHAAWLPDGKIRNVLTRGQEVHSWRLEVDLRFHDAIKLMTLAGEKIQEDSRFEAIPPAVATQWPTTIALGVPELGYIDKGIPSQSVQSWYEVDPDEFPYVLEITPIHKIWAEPEVLSNYTVTLIAKMEQGQCTMRLWRVDQLPEE